MVALEAQAAGTPVVGFDVDGLRDAVGDGGVLVPRGQRRGDARRGGGAARRPRPAYRGGRVAVAQAVLAEHSWDTIAARLEEIYAAARRTPEGHRMRSTR